MARFERHGFKDLDQFGEPPAVGAKMVGIPERLDDVSLDDLGAVEAGHGRIEIHLGLIGRLLVGKGGWEQAGRVVAEDEVYPGRKLFPLG